ncbi:MAG: hypothetical protein ABI233_12405 [Chthoniobacterales bacterium]
MKQIKSNVDYNDSIGQALGIEGSEQVGPDYATLAPILNLKISGGRVEHRLGLAGLQRVPRSMRTRGRPRRRQRFVMLAIDTTPGYTDTQPFPAAPAKWTYQAIYRLRDSRVGQWSSPASITVGV